jgi:hypothetical protein
LQCWSIETLQKLLDDPIYVAIAIEIEIRQVDEDSAYTHQMLSLSLMVQKAAAAGSADIVGYLLSFSHTQDIPYTRLIHRKSICPAMYSEDSAVVFEKVRAVNPDCVDGYMAHDHTPLIQAI